MKAPRRSASLQRLLCAAAAVSLALVGCRSKSPDPRSAKPAQAAEISGYVPGAATGEATLLLMADIRGVLKPCGCTVALQKGGFDRLAAFVEGQRRRFADADLLHAGPLFYEEPEVEPQKVAQRKRQAEVAAGLLSEVGVDVAGASAVDLGAARARYPGLVERADLKLTAANLEPAPRLGEGLVEPWVVREVGGLRVGVFALASPRHAGEVGGGVTIGEPREAARRAVGALESRTDVVVLLSGLGLRETKRLARAVDGIHFIVAGGLGEHPVTSDVAEEVGGARVMQFHREGRYVGRLTIRMVDGQTDFVDASAPSEEELEALEARIARLEESLEEWSETRPDDDRAVRSARHHLASLEAELERLSGEDVAVPEDRSSFSFRQTPLNWDLPQDADVLAVMEAFDEELKRINLAHVGSLPEPEEGEAVYVGVDECLGCHGEAKAFWDDDRHHEAWATLEEDGKTFDAECVHCHVTGYGEPGGSILGKTAGLQNVQCEACHGPGSLHVESGGDTDSLVEPTAARCATCHNEHHSPGFDFDRYRTRLLVPGHGRPLE
ncbi:MAG: multiheme c-type cytochrome [Myxococcota bacterium]